MMMTDNILHPYLLTAGLLRDIRTTSDQHHRPATYAAKSLGIAQEWRGG
jgi:hypothetical protein